MITQLSFGVLSARASHDEGPTRITQERSARLEAG